MMANQPPLTPLSGTEVPTLHGGIPPHDAEAEASILAAMLLDNAKSYDEVQAFLRAEHFYLRSHQQIYRAIELLLGDSQPVDLATVASCLKERGELHKVGGSPYLGELVDRALAVHNPVQYARRIFDYWRRRQVISLTYRMLKEAHMGVGDLQRWIESGGAELEEIAYAESTSRLELLGSVTERAIETIKTNDEEHVVAQTGLIDLDKKTGGLHETDLTIVASRPGMGKTGLVCTQALNVSRKNGGVAIWSLEMSKEQLALRFISAESGVDGTLIRDRNLTAAHWQDIDGARKRLAELPLWIDDTGMVSLQDIRSSARRLKREIDNARYPNCRRLSLLVIDYLQLMAVAQTRMTTREQEIAGLSRGLKMLSKELHVPILLVSQLNRAVEQRHRNKRPQLSDLRESGAIEQDADNVWMLYRPGYYDEEHPQSDAELILAKQRNGVTGTVHLFFHAATTSFRGLERDEFGEYTSDFDDGIDC